MSIINKMLQDLEARGGLKDKSEFTPEKLDKLAPSEINEEASNRSNFLIISGLMVLVYLGVYFWVKSPSTQMQPAVDNQLLGAQNNQPAPTTNNQDATIEPANQEKIATQNPTKPADNLSIEERVALHNARAEKLRQEAKATESTVMPTVTAEANKVAENKPAENKTVLTNEVKETIAKAPAPVKAKPAQVVQVAEATQAVKPKQINQHKNPIVSEAKRAPKTVAKANTLNRATLNKKQVEPTIKNTIKRVSPEQLSNNLYQEALDLIKDGRDINAQNKLAEALIAYPENHDARQTLAAILLESKNIAGAKNVLQKGVDITPSHNDFRMAAARLEIELNDQQAALRTLLDGDQYARNNVTYQAFLATILQRNERHNEAVKHFNDALNLDRSMGNAYVGLGISLQALQRNEEAIVAFEKAQQTHTLNEKLQGFVNSRLQALNLTVSAK